MRGAISLLLLLGAAQVSAQKPPLKVPAKDTVVAAIGPQYDASSLYRFFFGSRYRDLWTTPLPIPVLDLARFAGGITPTERGGGRQTKSLRFRGADGREYAFRSVDKDPVAVLPVELRETFARDIVQDQISSAHPLGALVVAPLLDAVGVLHAEPALVRLPDDPRLGEFRGDFANVIGLIEERPNDEKAGPAFAGARDVVGSAGLLDRLEENPHGRVDARAFLAARLIDVFLGDWDRHRDQWRWARFGAGDTASWFPIPRDRDQAFVRFDGLVLAMARQHAPVLLKFGPEYGSIEGATWNGRDLDRRILPALEWPAWDSSARALQARLSDAAIAEAVARLPREYSAEQSARLREALKRRRDALPAVARRYYQHLAREVDIHGSDRREVARVVRDAGGTVRVELTERTETGESRPFFTRRFLPGETDDLRIYLLGDDDFAITTGTGSGGPRVRVVGGGSDDIFVDSSRARGTRFYDERGDNVAYGGRIDTRRYRARPDTTIPDPHRDWGHRTITAFMPGTGPDVGLLLAWRATRTNYAFRKQPYSSQLRWGIDVATAAGSGRATLDATFYRENSRHSYGIDALASGIEVLRFYGLGNETPASLPAEDYRIRQLQARLGVTAGLSLASRTTVAVGPTLKFVRTDVDDGTNADRFIATLRPYGIGDVTQVGATIRFEHDTRDVPADAAHGLFVQLVGAGYPAALGLDSAFAEVHGRIATYLSADMPLHPVLALQAGGRKVFGDYPFYEAAFLGGRSNLRPYRSERFAGDAALFGSAELRLELARLLLIVPGAQGIFLFTDGGRVFVSNEESNSWHTGFGGGAWFSALGRGNVLQVSAARGTEGTRLYAGLGFPF